MSGKSIAKLIFACFLSSCYYSPAPIVIITPAAPPAGSIDKEPGKELDKVVKPPPGKRGNGPGGLKTTKEGNCLYKRGFIGGDFIEICEYSVNDLFNMCPTNVDECKTRSGNCSTTQPVAVPPSPCP